jgi:hypothetical protein
MRALLLLITLVSHATFASTPHEMSVGAQTEQICSDKTLRAVGRFLEIKEFDVTRSPDYAGKVTAAACRSNPGKPGTVIAAVAYNADQDDTKALVIVLLRESDGKVMAHHRSDIGEDAAMRVDSGSLWIDTAAYTLSTGVRAFGLDITSGYIPHCGDGGSGAERTLYVHEGNELRPIFGLTMSYWRFLRGGNPSCRANDQELETTVIATTRLTISLAGTSTNGYRDLIVTAVASADAEVPRRKRPFRYVVRYDGREYRSEGLVESFDKWND